MTARFSAILDANVLFPASLRDTLLRAARAGLYDAMWSGQILDEVSRNLIGTNRMTVEQVDHLRAQMQLFFPQATVAGYEALIPVLTNDEKDRHVLAAAIHGHAPVIVTVNTKHFPRVSLNPYGVEAQRPDDFLTRLYYVDPELVAFIIRQQAAALKRPMHTPEQVLDTLAQHAPRFVALARPSVVR